MHFGDPFPAQIGRREKVSRGGPEGGGDADSEKCCGLTRGIPRVTSPAQRVLLRLTHPDERFKQGAKYERVSVGVGVVGLTEGKE